MSGTIGSNFVLYFMIFLVVKKKLIVDCMAFISVVNPLTNFSSHQEAMDLLEGILMEEGGFNVYYKL